MEYGRVPAEINREFCRNQNFSLDFSGGFCIIRVQLNSLIKSGGGNGPMKPGNLLHSKVPNPAKESKDEGENRISFCPSGRALFLCPERNQI